jgi:hypothetical protein
MVVIAAGGVTLQPASGPVPESLPANPVSLIILVSVWPPKATRGCGGNRAGNRIENIDFKPGRFKKNFIHRSKKKSPAERCRKKSSLYQLAIFEF